MQYFVYIIYSQKLAKYYIGHTDSIQKRVNEHNIGKGGSFTSRGMPWELVYFESFSSRIEATKRERQIKGKKSKSYIELLIASAARASR